MKKLIALLFLPFLSCTAPKSLTADPHSFPIPYNTESQPITYQTKKTFRFMGVSASNEFPAARLNDFHQENDSVFVATISPENVPINPSPWYAFKIWSENKQDIYLKLSYTNNHKHRYHPKLSRDGEGWMAMDTTLLRFNPDSTQVSFKIPISPDTTWVAAQEIQDYKRVSDWVMKLEQSPFVTRDTAGVSAQGRTLHYLNLSKGAYDGKPTIVVLSRQHPPEVTGYFAMQSFLETLLDEGGENGFLEKYRVMVYPLMNPDGVDLGHYRHNTGGVDLNRDWSVYNQTEIQQITNHMVRETTMHKNKVLLGLDFHSTWKDVYYTPDESVKRSIPAFTKAWLEKIRVGTALTDINEKPGKISRPTSGGWFNQQFGATGITYEIGDDTPRAFIALKGSVSAQALMEILMECK